MIIGFGQTTTAVLKIVLPLISQKRIVRKNSDPRISIEADKSY